MKDFSYVTGPASAFIESLYNDFLNDSTTVDPEWKKFFEGFDFASSQSSTSGPLPTAKGGINEDQLAKEIGVFELIRAYRKRGHLSATTNPIRTRKDRHSQLELERFNLSDADLNISFFAGRFVGLKDAPLKDIIARLRTLYTGNVGIEYTYINDTVKCHWVQKNYEEMMKKQLSVAER